jgi:hypothetical protein
MQYHAGSLIKG